MSGQKAITTKRTKLHEEDPSCDFVSFVVIALDFLA